MSLKTELQIATRYLQSARKNSTVSIMALFAVLGVLLGVASIIIVLSVYTGFESALQKQIIGLDGEIVLSSNLDAPSPSSTAIVDSTDEIKSLYTVQKSYSLIRSGRSSTGVLIKSYNDAAFSSTENFLPKTLKINADLLAEFTADTDGIILGTTLAKRLHVKAGDPIQLVSPNGVQLPTGRIPRIVNLKVIGVFDTGMQAYDSGVGYTSSKVGELLSGRPKRYASYEAHLVDNADVLQVTQTLKDHFEDSMFIQNWTESNRNLFAALELEKLGLFIALSIVILVASLNIIGALSMNVINKSKEIAVLRAIGASRASIRRIFLFQGGIISVLGTVLGCLTGISVCIFLKNTTLITLPPGVYPMTTLPIELDALHVCVTVLFSIIITLTASVFPAHKATNIQPAQALSQEG